MLSEENTRLYLAENCPDHPGIRIAERQLYPVSETREVRFAVSTNVTVYWGCKPLRPAQIFKAFRGTHDICFQGRRLNLAFCEFSLVQEMVNRLTVYSN